jgi:hypothetical protein
LEPIEKVTDAKGNPSPTTGKDFKSLAETFFIAHTVLPGPRLTAEFLAEKLKLGHVLLIFNLPSGAGHTNVLYGMGSTDGDQTVLSVMDPSVPDPRTKEGAAALDKLTGAYRNRPLSDYKKFSALIVAWPGPIM